MFNPKKTVRQNIHGNEAAYSGTVTTVTHKTIVVFIPALDVEVDVQRSPDTSAPDFLQLERLSSHLSKVAAKESDYDHRPV